MKKFLVLYCAPVKAMQEMMQNPPPEDGMQPWLEWRDKHQDAIVEFGSPLGKNVRLKDAGVETVANEVGGYSILQGESAEAVAEALKDSPMFGMAGAYIDILPIVEVGG